MGGIKLGEAVAAYLASLEALQRQEFQQELNRFVRWYGWECPAGSLTPPEIASYAERAPEAWRLEAVRAFLVYAKREALTRSNLSIHLRPKKAEARPAAARRAPSPGVALTQEGRARLKEEVENLKGQLAGVIEEVRRARMDGDLSENAPYHAAREHQRQAETRVRELEAILAGAAEVKQTSPVGLGCTVVIRDLSSGEVGSYRLVHPQEVDPVRGRISVSSPLGRALFRRGEGEEVKVITPGGSCRYRIERIERQ